MKNKINSLLIFAYLSLFPFGQLPNLLVSLWQQKAMSIQLTDILLGILLVFNFKNILKIHFVWVLVFSLIFSLGYFNVIEIAQGFLYFVRLISYINLGVVIYNLTDTNKNKLPYILLSLISIIALFGWAQYLFLPDLRTLSILGWDDHYFRLAGTFLDPAFTGILLVLGILLAIFLYKKTKASSLLVLCLLLLVTLGFTYSRASYLAAVTGIAVLVYRWIPRKFILMGLVVLSISITQLPRPAGGEGVKLERLFSIDLKIKNSIHGLSYVSSSPLFGYGYNNSCALQKTYGSSSFIKSNSCSGFDNSVIYFLVTTGMVGLIVAAISYRNLMHEVKDEYKELVLSLTSAIFVHGMFTNTFVYPWVLGFMAIIFGYTLKKKVN